MPNPAYHFLARWAAPSDSADDMTGFDTKSVSMGKCASSYVTIVEDFSRVGKHLGTISARRHGEKHDGSSELVSLAFVLDAIIALFMDEKSYTKHVQHVLSYYYMYPYLHVLRSLEFLGIESKYINNHYKHYKPYNSACEEWPPRITVLQTMLGQCSTSDDCICDVKTNFCPNPV